MLGSNQPMFVAWGPERTLLYNEAYSAILADKHPEAFGRPFLDVWAEIRDAIEPLVAKAYAGEPVHMDEIMLVMNRRGYPEETHFSFSYTPVRDDAGGVAGFFCVCAETTRQVLAEKRLAASEARSQGVLQGMREGFILLDHEFRVLDINDEGMRLEERPRDAIVGKTHWEAWPGTEQSELGRLYKDAMSRRVPVSLEHRYVWPDGHDLWLEMRAYPHEQGLAIFYRDVTERKHAEERLRASEEFSRRVLQSSADCIKVLSLDGRLEFMSEGGKSVMEVDDFTAVQGVYWPEVWPEETRAQVGAAIRQAASGGTATFQGFARTAKGTPRWWDVVVSPILGPDGRPERLLSVSRDITERKQANDALEQSESVLGAVLDALPVGVIIADASGAIIRDNPANRELWGVPPHTAGWEEYGEWVGYWPKTGERIKADEWAMARALLKGEVVTGELVQNERFGTGEKRFYLNNAAPVRDAAGSIVAGVVVEVDVTEQLSVEQALRETGERYRLAGRATNDAIWDWDLAGDCIVWNEALTALFGHEPEGLQTSGGWWKDHIHPDDRRRVVDGIMAVIAGDGDAWSDEYRFLTANGGVVHVFDRGTVLRDAGGRAVRMIGAMLDLTERRRAEAALQALNQGLEQRVAEALAERKLWADIFEHSDALIAAVDTERRFLALNKAYADAFETVFGVRPRVGDVLPEILAGHELEPMAVRLWDRALSGEEFVVTEPFDDPDRVRPYLELRFNTLRDAEGRLLAAYHWAVDVTERLRGQARLAAAEEALRQSQKMEAVGQLTGGIAHDFNNMLAVVIGSLDLLGRRIDPADARPKRYVGSAMDGARRAALLTQRLLAFSRQQPLRPEAVDANKLVAGMSELLRHSLGGGVRLETILAGGLWRTNVDPNQLENVILNLAVNARDAMAEGGRLTVETQNAHLDHRYATAHLGVPAGQYVLIAVSDTGEGMAPEVIAKAFDPFYTTKDVGKGTGLGLSQVYGFVKQSGGHVKIYSEVGRGTTVKVYLPRLLGGDAAETSQSDDGAELLRGDQREMVLVVEDEASVREVSVAALETLGYRVLEADGARAALRQLDAHPEISLLFTDVVMPDVDGRKLADEARRRRPGLKVLFTTGYTRNAVVHNGVLDPGVQLLGKPFTLDELSVKVREVIDQDLDERKA